jgi:LysR family transcriptional activator of nhaA
MPQLNYHHLRYFRAVATEGHLGRAAEKLNLSQSALSIQIKQLEAQMGHAFFDRVGRGLVLTEAGRIALDHAERIFTAGEELMRTLEGREGAARPLRVGAESTLSRNFQMQVLRPLLADGSARVELKSGSTKDLLNGLETLALDLVLSHDVPPEGDGLPLAAQRIAQQPVEAHGAPARLRHESLAELLASEPIILPTQSVIRAGFEALASRLGVEPNVVAHVDDMAMVRLLAREDLGVALAPRVVLADEIASGRVQTAPFALGIIEPFFALTLPRRFPHPALSRLDGMALGGS